MEQHPAGAGLGYNLLRKSETRSPKSEGNSRAEQAKTGKIPCRAGACAPLLDNSALMGGHMRRGTSAGALDYASFVVSASA